LHLVNKHLKRALSPVPFRQTGLTAEVVEKLFRVGELLPHLGEKGGTAPSLAEDNPVDSWAQFAEQLLT
jgi:hypothetical protein